MLRIFFKRLLTINFKEFIKDFSCMKNRINYNKLKFFTKISGLDFTSSNYTLYSRESGYINKQSHVKTKTLLYHFLSEKTAIALPRYEHSKIYIIDIDYRNNHRPLPGIIRDLVDLLGIPFYLEKGLSKGYHLYFKYTEYISVEFWKWFIKYFKEKYKAEIEPIYGKKQIKVPYSLDYKAAGTYSYNSRTQIYKKVTCFDDVYKIFSSPKVNFPPEIYIQNKEELKIESSLKAFRCLYDENEHNVDFSYGCGTRHRMQIPLGFYTIKNKGTFENFLQACYYWNDGSSKDMNLPYHKMIKVVEGVWKFCESHFNGKIMADNNSVQTTTKPNKLKIDFKFYKMRDKEKNQLRELLRYYYRKYNIKCKPEGKIEKRIIEECVKIVEVMNEIKNYRQRLKYKYKNESMDYLNKGIPFGLELQKMVAKKFNIANIQEKIDFLEWIGIIQILKDENGFSYSYKKLRYVKHFIIRTIRKLYRKLKDYVSKIKYNIDKTFNKDLDEIFICEEVIGYG